MLMLEKLDKMVSFLFILVWMFSLLSVVVLLLPVLLEQIKELREEVHSVALGQHVMNEKLPKITEYFINPSEYKKSKHKETFMDLMQLFGFGRVSIASRVVAFAGTPPLKSAELDYTFRWEKGQEEGASYGPLMKHLNDHGIDTVCVAEGQGLPDGLLYYEELWTLKENTSLRSEYLRKIGQESVFKYTLRGRTDLVRRKKRGIPLGKSNNQYFIEIKRVEDFVEEDSLRESVLQLIGGNASNSFHSPPVLLTNLAKMHYVLFITLVGDPTVKLQFDLNVVKMPSFGVALAFVEEQTTDMKSVTLHLGRRPTPPSSPPKAKNNSESEDGEDIAERFHNASLQEAVTDENGDEV
jgi:hypothetical protein